MALITGAGLGDRPRERRAVRRRGRRRSSLVDLKGAEETVAAIEARGRRAPWRSITDVADEAAVAAMAAKAARRFGKRRRAVNNAGILDDYLPAADTPTAVWDRVLGVNLLRPVLHTPRALIPQMVESGGGAIVNVASTAALIGGNGGAAYTTSKHAIIGFTRQLCFDYAARRASAATWSARGRWRRG